MVPFVDIVLREGDASTRYKLALAGPGGDGAARRASIRRSERVAALLSERGHDDCIAQHPTRDGRARIGFSPPLADLGYQPGDMALLPPARPGSGVVARRTSAAPGGRRVLTPILMIAGRARIHASLEGNALYAFLALGLATNARERAVAAVASRAAWTLRGRRPHEHPSKRRCGRFPARRCCQGSALVRIQFAVDHTPFRKEGGPKAPTTLPPVG